MRAFNIDGLDLNSNTVVVEIERSILLPIAQVLQEAPASTRHSAEAVRCLGARLRNAASVLYRERTAEQFGFTVFDPEEDEEQVRTGTGG